MIHSDQERMHQLQIRSLQRDVESLRQNRDRLRCRGSELLRLCDRLKYLLWCSVAAHLFVGLALFARLYY